MTQRPPAFPFALSIAASLFFLAISVSAIRAEQPPVEAAMPSSDSAPTIHVATWTIETQDGQTGKPIPNIAVSIRRWEKGERGLGVQWQKSINATSDDAGILQLELRKRGGASISVRDDQFIGGSVFSMIGASPWEGLIDGRDGQSNTGPRPPSTDDQPFVVKCWRGTEIHGRLVQPDGTPRAGAKLNVGVFINNYNKLAKQLGYELPRHTFNHGEWPNWTTSATTDEDGYFRAAVPPSTIRTWVRIGTGPLGFGGIDVDRLRKVDDGHVLLKFARLEAELRENKEKNGKLDFGTLTLSRGVTVRGRVLDAKGRPLPGARLHTSGRHGPYAGRETTTDESGNFVFGPMNPGWVKLKVDVHPRDATGKVISNDVRAVFGHTKFNVPKSGGPVELVIQAEPHRVVEFEWIDRRLNPGSVGFYGYFRVSGRLPRDGEPKGVYWSGETVKVTRDGKVFLVVKVPKNLVDAALHLSADKKGIPSYRDSRGSQPSGSIDLGNLAMEDRRVIYCDPPPPR